MVKSVLEAGILAIENRRTENSAWLLDDDEDRPAGQARRRPRQVRGASFFNAQQP